MNKLQWLMFFRIVMITVLLGSTLIFGIGESSGFFDSEYVILTAIIVAEYALTILYALLLHVLRYLTSLAYFQLFMDIFLASSIIMLTGKMDSPFSFLLSLTVLNASIILYRKGAVVIAVASFLVIIGLFLWEISYNEVPLSFENQVLRVLSINTIVNIAAIFLVSLLSSYLSERLRFASEDLRTIKTINEHVINSITSGMVGFSLDNRIIFFNPAAEKITGLLSKDVQYQDVRDLFPSLEERATLPEDRWEASFRRSDGEQKCLGFSISPLIGGFDKHRGWILIFQDLTPFREMENRVRRSEQLAAVGKMAAAIAHEIRNPLGSMSGSLQLLRELSGGNTEKKLVEIALREIDRLNNLVTDFLKFSRPIPPKASKFELGKLLDDIVGFYLMDTEEDQLISINHDRSINIEADYDQLKQVFLNLIRNSIDSNDRNQEIRIVTHHTKNDLVTVDVIDKGTGIREELLDQVFDPFFTTKSDGTGLGLPTSLRIIEGHGGYIDVKSKIGQGSKFSVVLPTHQSKSKERSE